MTAIIETISIAHLNSPALQALMPYATIDLVSQVERDGGVARAIVLAGQTVGFVMIGVDHEVMIAVDESHRHKGVATAALKLAFDVALKEKGITQLVASTLIGRPSNGLVAKVGGVETSRNESQISYRFDLS